MYLLKDSDAYRLSKQYISENPWVQQEVGNTIKFGIIQNSEVIIKGASGEANLTINVSGDKGEITVTIMLEKKDGNWQVIKAGYIDKAGNYIDIMEPHGRGKKQAARGAPRSIFKVRLPTESDLEPANRITPGDSRDDRIKRPAIL